MINPDDLAIVALGSNLPGEYESSLELLEAAVSRLPSAGLSVLKVSKWWRSKAWPNPADPDYLNGVALVETDLEPLEALTALLNLEVDFGRIRGVANAPRTLDLDLVAMGRRIINSPRLVLPHPRAHLRQFVMGPLAELAPGWRHPISRQTALSLHGSAAIGESEALS